MLVARDVDIDNATAVDLGWEEDGWELDLGVGMGLASWPFLRTEVIV